MLMKYYLSYMVIFISCCYLNGVDQEEHEQNRFLVCNEIKKIDPNASRAKYRRLVQDLSKNNLSVCACITYLVKEREKRAIELINQNISEKAEHIIKETYKQEQEKDNALENGIPLPIYCSPSIDADIQTSVAEKFSREYRTTIIVSDKEVCGPGVIACVRRWVAHEINSNDSDSVKFTVKNPEMGITALFEKNSPDARNAVLEHERYHLKEDHSLLHILSEFFLRNNKGYHINSTLNDQQQKLCAKLGRAHESAADRVPAACNDCKLASDFVKFFGSTSNSTKNEFSKQPPAEKRSRWAQRIYNLKSAEQEIKKDEMLHFLTFYL